MDGDPVVILTTLDRSEAELLKGYLETAGIGAAIRPSGSVKFMEDIIGAVGRVDVVVDPEEAEDARALVEAMRRGELEAE